MVATPGLGMSSRLLILKDRPTYFFTKWPCGHNAVGYQFHCFVDSTRLDRCFARTLKRPWARAINRTYVEALRSVPVLVMILWVYYGLPVMSGISLNTFWAGMLALAFCDSAFEAEIFRAGIQSIEKGQHDAAESLGPATVQKCASSFCLSLRRVLPAIGNQFVYMIKMSSLVSVIGMTELTRRANELVVSQYRPLKSTHFWCLSTLY